MHNALDRLRTPLRIIAALLFIPLTAGAADVRFTNPTSASYETDDGTVSLVWTAEDGSRQSDPIFEVRRWQAGSPSEGILIYEGRDTASFVSGLSEGQHVFRIGLKSDQSLYPIWGDTNLVVDVDYIDMAIVWPLMGAGALCFAVLIITIILGRREASKTHNTQKGTQ